MNTELSSEITRICLNKHGKSAKDIRFPDFYEITGHGRNNIR